MLASLLLAYTIYDFLPAPVAVPPAPAAVVLEEGEGALSIMVKPTDGAGTVARGATRIPMLTLELGASCEAPVTVSEITLHHTGQGNPRELRLYALSGYRRVSRSSGFDGSGEAILRLSRMTVPACDVTEIQIVADLSTEAEAAGEHGVELRGASDIRSSAGTTEVLTEQTTSSRVISSPLFPGDVTLRFLPTRVPMLYGTRQTLARLQISTDAEGAHVLHAITLLNRGSARDYNFIDLRIEDRRGNVLTRLAEHMDGRTVTLHFDPTVILDRSETRVLILTGEVRTSYARTVHFELEEESDLVTSPYRRRLP